MHATHTVPTYTGSLSVGFRAGYTDLIHDKSEAVAVIQEYCNRVGLCVTVTDTTFIYTQSPATPHGFEPGIVVGFINYPRFPCEPEDIRKHATAVGELLKAALGQNRVTVVYPDETSMVGEKK
jgi:hypothetical protein